MAPDTARTADRAEAPDRAGALDLAGALDRARTPASAREPHLVPMAAGGGIARTTARRAGETPRRSVQFEVTWQRAVRAMRASGLTRDELARTARALGRTPLTDQEWADIDEHR
ncbi:hypothetical protein [Sphaerisporangium dianthi]|uniref:Uncharacterized protein n=1 Tax=Sphaerisporangium dianthi TaxID=1436120 RepID=A0ABV9CHD3_9ACTN